jgi:hypothetical protein
MVKESITLTRIANFTTNWYFRSGLNNISADEGHRRHFRDRYRWGSPLDLSSH